MHVSRALKYAYIGIPRTGSKSMFQWLKDNLRLSVEERLTCPEEGMPPDVYVRIHLGPDTVIDKVRL